MDQFLRRHKLSKFTQEEINHLNRSISIKEIESIINNLPKQKTLGSAGFTGEFCQTFKEKMVAVLYSLFRKCNQREHFLTCSVKPALL